jgi:tripartite ATP-independent transporter DctM subunit
MPVAIVGGILGGVFTATEASAVAVFYALIVGGLIYRELTWRRLTMALDESVRISVSILFIISAAALFAWMVTSFRIGPELARLVSEATQNRFVFLLLVNLFFLLVGCVLDTVPAILIFTPIFMPAATSLGVDPYHLGVVIVFNLLIGLITPPYGLTMFIVSRIADITPLEFVRNVGPVFATLVATLLLITAIPDLVLALPEFVFGKP